MTRPSPSRFCATGTTKVYRRIICGLTLLGVAAGVGCGVPAKSDVASAGPATVGGAATSAAEVASNALRPEPSLAEGQPHYEPKVYPRGRWRLAPFATLMQTNLAVSHLLIRHVDASTMVSLNALGWRAPSPSSNRSRAEALQLAERLARQAQQSPERFAELAGRFSEDPVTAPTGGELGMVAASELTDWPEVLDALAATEPEQITHAVETPFGFHVFRRNAPRVRQTLSGDRIVVRHTDAPFIRYAARGVDPGRSRSEALELARRVYEEARSSPQKFDELVQRYSEHEDAARGGYFGTWSNQEPTPLSRELLTLERLELGEVAPPLDTAFGFQIIRRIAERPHVEFAMTSIVLPFDPTAAKTAGTSKHAVRARAQALAREIAKDAGRFAPLQREHCCIGAERVIEGRESPVFEAVLARLEPGEVALDPVEYNQQYFIIKRLEASELPPRMATLLELPAPPAPDWGYVISQYSGAFLEAQLRATSEGARSLFSDADAVTASQLRELLAVPGRFPVDSPEGRLEAFRDLDARVRQLLQGAQYEAYRALLNRQVEAAILNQP